MDDQELKEAIRAALDDTYSYGGFNTNEKADELRAVLQLAADYPALNELEKAWNILSNFYGCIDDQQVIDRERHPSNTPLESYNYYVELGAYPPPEIMLAIQLCFQKYFDGRGCLSLDEAFFGEPHKKMTSTAHRKAKKWSYMPFDFFYMDGPGRPNNSVENSSKESQELLANKYLASPESCFPHDYDVDTFLRGYRRWKAKTKKEPPE